MDDNKQWAELMLKEQRGKLTTQIGAILVVWFIVVTSAVALYCLIDMSL